MSHVLAKIQGVKIEDIKKALAHDAAKHAEHGLELEHLWQNDDDRSEVQFLFKSHDLPHAKEFIKKVHEEAKKKDPSINVPSMTFLEGEDDPELEFDLELPEGESKEEEEEKEASASEPVSQSMLNSIALAASGLLVGAAIGYGGASITLSCPIPDMMTTDTVTIEPATPPRPTPSPAPAPKGSGTPGSAATAVEGTPVIDESVFGTGEDATDAPGGSSGAEMETGTLPSPVEEGQAR